MEDIIINGINLNELGDRKEIIREGSTKIISDNIELVKSLNKKLLISNDTQEIKNFAQKAIYALKKAKFIGEKSGIKVILPYLNDYQNNEDEVLSYQLDESENKLVNEFNTEELKELYGLLSGMEGESHDWIWDSSSC